MVSQSIQHPLIQSINWLKNEINKYLGQDVDVNRVGDVLAGLKALKVNQAELSEESGKLAHLLNQSINLDLGIKVELPKTDPEGYVTLLELLEKFDTNKLREFTSSVLDDATRLQLPDGSILGNHLAFTYILFHIDLRNSVTQAAITHVKKVLMDKLIKKPDTISATDLFLLVHILDQSKQIPKEAVPELCFSIVSRQKKDGSWGDLEETIYLLRTLIVLDNLSFSDSIAKGLNFLKTKVDQHGSLAKSLRLTSLFLILWYEYSSRLIQFDELLNSTGILTNELNYDLQTVLSAAVRRAQTKVVAVNMQQEFLVNAVVQTASIRPEMQVTFLLTKGTPLPDHLLTKLKERASIKMSAAKLSPMLVVDSTVFIIPAILEDVNAVGSFVIVVSQKELVESLLKVLQV
jgi:hypothetical protein